MAILWNKALMDINRQKIAQLLRKTNLLPLADNVMLVRDIIKNRKSNQLFLKKHPDFKVPPYILAYDAYNQINWQSYYNMGLIHASLVSELISKYIHGNEIRICEWGCGPGRIIRHLERINGKVGRPFYFAISQFYFLRVVLIARRLDSD